MPQSGASHYICLPLDSRRFGAVHEYVRKLLVASEEKIFRQIFWEDQGGFASVPRL